MGSIQNFGETSLTLSISLKPFTASESENGEVLFQNDLADFPDPSLFSKVQILDGSVPIQKITLSAEQKKDLTLKINLPKNQQKGDYIFSIIFSSSPANPTNNSSSLASAGIATNVLLSVGPLGKTQGILEKFSGPSFVTKGPLPFTVRLKNTSDHYISPTGIIVIKNMFGQKIGKVELLPVNILANSVRRMPDSLQSGAAKDKDYEKIKNVVEKNDLPVAVWPEKFLLGPYTATLNIALSQDGPFFTKNIYFFAFPAEYMLGIILIIALVVFIVLRVRKKMS